MPDIHSTVLDAFVVTVLMLPVSVMAALWLCWVSLGGISERLIEIRRGIEDK